MIAPTDRTRSGEVWSPWTVTPPVRVPRRGAIEPLAEPPGPDPDLDLRTDSDLPGDDWVWVPL